jgi:hypothetical protein
MTNLNQFPRFPKQVSALVPMLTLFLIIPPVSAQQNNDICVVNKSVEDIKINKLPVRLSETISHPIDLDYGKDATATRVKLKVAPWIPLEVINCQI